MMNCNAFMDFKHQGLKILVNISFKTMTLKASTRNNIAMI